MQQQPNQACVCTVVRCALTLALARPFHRFVSSLRVLLQQCRTKYTWGFQLINRSTKMAAHACRFLKRRASTFYCFASSLRILLQYCRTNKHLAFATMQQRHNDGCDCLQDPQAAPSGCGATAALPSQTAQHHGCCGSSRRSTPAQAWGATRTARWWVWLSALAGGCCGLSARPPSASGAHTVSAGLNEGRMLDRRGLRGRNGAGFDLGARCHDA